MSGSPKVEAEVEAMLAGPHARDAQTLNLYAWDILDPKAKAPNPDYAVALRLAEAAAKASELKVSRILDTYALALFKTGDKTKAVKIQTRAVELARTNNPENLKGMQECLEEYKKTASPPHPEGRSGGIPPALADDSVATLPSGQSSTTVSFDPKSARLIVVPIRINGQGPFLFLLDSGACSLILDEGLARKLGLKQVGESHVSHRSNGKDATFWETDAATLQIREAALTKQQFFAEDASWFKTALEREDVGGLLGWDFFNKFVVRIEAAHRTVTLSLPTPEPPESGGEVLPLGFTPARVPTLKCKIDGSEGTFILDTGCDMGVLLNGPFLKKHHLREKFGAQMSAGSATGNEGSERLQFPPPMLLNFGSTPVELNAHFLPGNKMVGGEKAADGLIGLPVIISRPATFDYRHKRLVLDPMPKAVAGAQ